MAAKLLQECPSYYEIATCHQCEFCDIPPLTPVLNVHSCLQPDLSNLAAAIERNFPNRKCQMCKEDMSLEYVFSDFIFIDVSLSIDR